MFEARRATDGDVGARIDTAATSIIPEIVPGTEIPEISVLGVALSVCCVNGCLFCRSHGEARVETRSTRSAIALHREETRKFR